MKRIIYGTVLVAAVHLLTADALTCETGVVCIHDVDGSELCAEHSYGSIHCPAGSQPKNQGVVVPICDSGNVACIHNNDATGFCYPGYLCPAGSTQVGPVNLPACPDNKQMCVYGSMYGCFDWECPPGMTPVGTTNCAIPPKECDSGEKLCVYDIGNAFACQSSGFDCWPGTHEWKSCGPSLDFAFNRIKLSNGHFIQCILGLQKIGQNVYCKMPIFDTSSWPLHYAEGNLLKLSFCGNQDNSMKWLLPVAKSLGFSSVSGYWADADQVSTVPSTWYSEFYKASSDYLAGSPDVKIPEYCYLDGELVYWTDPACTPSTEIPGTCYVTSLYFNA